MKNKVNRALKYILTLVFVFFCLVQYNDPDPYLWIPIYLVPIFLIWHKGKPSKFYLTIIGLLYFLWAINQFPPSWEGLTLNELGMKTVNIELGRESLGLGFTAICVWLFLFLD
jgi:energy-coupling factor transporter transmembrane protein EcfT